MEPETSHVETIKTLKSPPESSCDVCRDLMPLVCDGVASDDSAALVAAHTDSCETCRAMLKTGNFSASPEAKADADIIQRLRKTLLLRSGVIALAGVAGGAVLSYIGNVYIIWWLPFVGLLAYFLMRRRWWLAPAAVGVLTALGVAFTNLWVGGISLDMLLVMPLYLGVQWLVYTAVGTAVGALLHFAFGKEK